MEVFLVRHVRHARFLDGSPTIHRDEDGELIWDEWDGDDLKTLGLYATEAEAEARIERARRQPGFRDEPDCFQVEPYTLGEDLWTDGFVTIHDEDQQAPDA